MAKKTQRIMIWLLPLIVIGGLFYPLVGYLVAAMMVFFLIMSFFKGRYWCWNLCPRGAFLDIFIAKVSVNRRMPGIFTKQWFRWLIFTVFIGFLSLRVVKTGGDPVAIGGILVSACLVTTGISIFLGVGTKHRGWCVICPMGTLQEKIGKLSRPKAKNNPTTG